MKNILKQTRLLHSTNRVHTLYKYCLVIYNFPNKIDRKYGLACVRDRDGPFLQVEQEGVVMNKRVWVRCLLPWPILQHWNTYSSWEGISYHYHFSPPWNHQTVEHLESLGSRVLKVLMELPHFPSLQTNTHKIMLLTNKAIGGEELRFLSFASLVCLFGKS